MTTSNIATRQRSCTFDCGGARIRARRHHLATVVTVRGVVDADNADRIGAYLRRFTLGECPVVLDMSDVNLVAAPAISLLHAFDAECDAAGVEWTLIADPVTSEPLTGEAAFPVAGSVHEALHNLADDIASRRRLVLPLIRKTA